MNYEEFKKEIIKCSNDEECIMAIHRSDEKTRFNFKADETGMYSSLWHNPLNEGFISWKKVEELLEKGLWQNYPLGKKTVMNVDGKEYVIEVYFLTDVN